MADSVNEELDYKESGKDELDWGYEEGKEVFVCVCRSAEKVQALLGVRVHLQMGEQSSGYLSSGYLSFVVSGGRSGEVRRCRYSDRSPEAAGIRVPGVWRQ